MQTQKTLSDVMAQLRPSLQTKLTYSINLLRKAEKLAFRYDPEGFVLAFSGGKDSQALFHVAQLAGVHFKAQMNLTSVDPPEVIRFVRHAYPEVDMQAPERSIFSEAARKGLLPTMNIRWCCKTFKELKTPGKVTLIGIRHAESTRRAKRNEVEITRRKFSGTLEELGEYRDSLKGKKYLRKDRITIEPDGEQTVSCIRGKETLLISPIIHWTDDDVWEFLSACDVPHCELYDKGFKRIGCILCPMSQPKQKRMEIERYPHVRRNWLKAIKKIREGRKNSKGNIYGGISRLQYFSGGDQQRRRDMRSYIRLVDIRQILREMVRGEISATTPIHRIDTKEGPKAFLFLFTHCSRISTPCHMARPRHQTRTHTQP